MSRAKFIIPVLGGLIVGQLFAEGERPFGLENTLRVGYNDNLYRNGNEESSAFITDIIDLSFRAAMSDRTEFTAKSRITLSDDDDGMEVYPNLHAMLSHSVSPRLLFRLSDYLRTGDKAGSIENGKNKRYNYLYNNVRGEADYVLADKDRLNASGEYSIMRHEGEVDTLDWTTTAAGLSWKHELIQQRTHSTLGVTERWTDYDNRDSSFEATDLTAGLNHTFNPALIGHIEAGASYVRPDFPAPSDNDEKLNPLVRGGLTFSPSPRTRLSVDGGHSYAESDDNGYGGQTVSDIIFGVQHDITAKLMAKATARFARTKYDAEDRETALPDDRTEDRMDFELRLSYKINRINFIEVGARHTEKDTDTDSDWEQNVVDVGWRVVLN